MTSKKFCDDKVLKILLYIQLIGGILTAFGYGAGMLPWVIRGVCAVTAIALTLLIQSKYPSHSQVIVVCVGLALSYVLRAVAFYPSIGELLSAKKLTVQGNLLVLRFTLFIVILLAQAIVYLGYISNARFFEKFQKLLRTKYWLITSFSLIVAYFLISLYIGIGVLFFSQEKEILSQMIGFYVYSWMQDVVSRGITYYTYFRSITWYKHVGQIAPPEK